MVNLKKHFYGYNFEKYTNNDLCGRRKWSIWENKELRYLAINPRDNQTTVRYKSRVGVV
jgi:hypothetical protein